MIRSSTLFDPKKFATAYRDGRLKPLTDADLPSFGPRGMWRAGAVQLGKALVGLWVGEGANVGEVLRSARTWLEAPPEQGTPWSDGWRGAEARHALARALARRLMGQGDVSDWAAAAERYDAALAHASLEGRDVLAPAAVLCAAMAGRDDPVPDILPADPEGRAIVELVRLRADPLAAGEHLYAVAEDVFRRQPDLEVTALFLLLFQTGVMDAVTALRAGYVICPALRLPPGMTGAGWSDDAAATFVPKTGPEPVGACLRALGLRRDAAVQPSDPSGFVSWTRHPDLSLEADWCAGEDMPDYLEIRGTGAARLAAYLAAALGGHAGQGPEAALTELLTVPARSTPANASAAQIRWETLCVAVTGAGVFDEMPARALVSAGLADSDWRVRVAALWAVGHHRMHGLGQKAQGAALPALDDPSLSQDDRRVLLCLRDLATARSAGLQEPLKNGADSAFVAIIGAALDAVPRDGDKRAAALICAILRQPMPKACGSPPVAWQAWMAMAPANR